LKFVLLIFLAAFYKLVGYVVAETDPTFSNSNKIGICLLYDSLEVELLRIIYLFLQYWGLNTGPDVS
jgi:hypothetical protein